MAAGFIFGSVKEGSVEFDCFPLSSTQKVSLRNTDHALADRKDGQIAFKVFKVSDAFNQVEAECKKASFDKRRDASETGTARSESIHRVPCLLISCLA